MNLFIPADGYLHLFCNRQSSSSVSDSLQVAAARVDMEGGMETHAREDVDHREVNERR